MPCVSTACVAKTLPLPCGSQALAQAQQADAERRAALEAVEARLRLAEEAEIGRLKAVAEREHRAAEETAAAQAERQAAEAAAADAAAAEAAADRARAAADAAAAEQAAAIRRAEESVDARVAERRHATVLQAVVRGGVAREKKQPTVLLRPLRLFTGSWRTHGGSWVFSGREYQDALRSQLAAQLGAMEEAVQTEECDAATVRRARNRHAEHSDLYVDLGCRGTQGVQAAWRGRQGRHDAMRELEVSSRQWVRCGRVHSLPDRLVKCSTSPACAPRSYADEDGDAYYFNVITQVTSWEPPASGWRNPSAAELSEAVMAEETEMCDTAFAVCSHCLRGQDAAFPCGPQVRGDRRRPDHGGGERIARPVSR